MNELSSTEFRKTFARLTEEIAVTVHGHRIGVWTPHATPTYGTMREVRARVGADAAQAQRDALLRKINRKENR